MKKRKLPRKVKKSTLKRKADILFSLLIRSRGSCEMCGKTQNLQCAHVYSRSNLHLRYDPKNALCLCSGCHMFRWHKEPADSILWFQGVYKDEWEYLVKEKNIIEHTIDYEKIIKLLKG